MQHVFKHFDEELNFYFHMKFDFQKEFDEILRIFFRIANAKFKNLPTSNFYSFSERENNSDPTQTTNANQSLNSTELILHLTETLNCDQHQISGRIEHFLTCNLPDYRFTPISTSYSDCSDRYARDFSVEYADQ